MLRGNFPLVIYRVVIFFHATGVNKIPQYKGAAWAATFYVIRRKEGSVEKKREIFKRLLILSIYCGCESKVKTTRNSVYLS